MTLAKRIGGLVLGVAAALGVAACSTEAPEADAAPTLTLTPDTEWWQPPADKPIGDISAVAVGPDGDIYVLHRPRSLAEEEQASAALPVVRFSPDGAFVAEYGGPGEGYDWPRNEHSLAVDDRGHFWVSGSFRDDPADADDAILEFDADGNFVKQIGAQGASTGDADTDNVRAASDLFVDDEAGELYVSDGYVNHRVIVFDRDTGDFKRMWGGFGSQPPVLPEEGAPEGEEAPGFNELHGIEMAADGTVYVADRRHQRIQMFTSEGEYLGQFRVDPGMEEPRTASGMALSGDEAQLYLYVSDWGNSRLLAFDRESQEELLNIGGAGSEPGQMQGPHLIASDADGVVYVAEVAGRRIQRFIPDTGGE